MTDTAAPMIIDGLLICKWTRQIFEAMQQSGLSAANCTCAQPYANLQDSFRSMAQFHKWFADYSDIIRPV